MLDDGPPGATAIDEDELGDLIPGHIQTRDELNLWEQENILQAVQWSERARLVALDESFVRELHRRMFDRTWIWAGRYRKTDKNLGVDWPQISADVRSIIDDGKYWLEHGTYSVDEVALRLHHRLVRIHPFPNGNGRHGRLWCDVVLSQNGRSPFVWKSRELDHAGTARSNYIAALKAADGHDYGPLLALILRDR